MSEENATKKENKTRREVLKKVGKTSAIVIPTIASFKVSDLAVAASGSMPPKTPSSKYGD